MATQHHLGKFATFFKKAFTPPLFLCLAFFAASTCHSDDGARRFIVDRKHHLMYRLPRHPFRDWGKTPSPKEIKFQRRIEDEGFKRLTLVAIDYTRSGEFEFEIRVKAYSPNSLKLERQFKRKFLESMNTKGELFSAKEVRYRDTPALILSYSPPGFSTLIVEEWIFYHEDKLISVSVSFDKRSRERFDNEIREMFESVRFLPPATFAPPSKNRPMLIDSEVGIIIESLPSFEITDPIGKVRLRSWSRIDRRKWEQTVTISRHRGSTKELVKQLWSNLKVERRGTFELIEDYNEYDLARGGYLRLSAYQREAKGRAQLLNELLTNGQIGVLAKVSIAPNQESTIESHEMHAIKQERRRWGCIEPTSKKSASMLELPGSWTLRLDSLRKDCVSESRLRPSPKKLLKSLEELIRLSEKKCQGVFSDRIRIDQSNRIVGDANRKGRFSKSHFGQLTREYFKQLLSLQKSDFNCEHLRRNTSVIVGQLILNPEVDIPEEFERLYKQCELGPNDQLYSYYSQLLAATRNPGRPAFLMKRRPSSSTKFISWSMLEQQVSNGRKYRGRQFSEYQNLFVRENVLRRASILGDQALPLFVEVMTWNDYPLPDIKVDRHQLYAAEQGHEFIEMPGKKGSHRIQNRLVLKKPGKLFLLAGPDEFEERMRFNQRHRAMKLCCQLLEKQLGDTGSNDLKKLAELLFRDYSDGELADSEPTTNWPIFGFKFRQGLPWDRESFAILVGNFGRIPKNQDKLNQLKPFFIFKLILEEAGVIKPAEDPNSLDSLGPCMNFLQGPLKEYSRKLRQYAAMQSGRVKKSKR